MSRFDNSPNYGLMFFIALIAAGISAAATRMISGGNEAKFAVVDVQRVVVASKDVAALKNERDNQIKELQKMADDANAKIAKISDEAEKKKTEKPVKDFDPSSKNTSFNIDLILKRSRELDPTKTKKGQ